MAPTITREELRSYLGKVGWPTSNLLLADLAKQRGAPQGVLEILNRIPGRVYMSERDLWDEVQKQLKLVATS